MVDMSPLRLLGLPAVLLPSLQGNHPMTHPVITFVALATWAQPRRNLINDGHPGDKIWAPTKQRKN